MTKSVQFNCYHAIVRGLMRELGVKSIRATYSGSGDSGMYEMEEVELMDGRTAWVSDTRDGRPGLDGYPHVWQGADGFLRVDDLSTVAPREKEVFDLLKGWVRSVEVGPIRFSEAVDHLVGVILGIKCPGWENNEGAKGVITITLEKAIWDHVWYDTQEENITKTIQLDF